MQLGCQRLFVACLLTTTSACGHTSDDESSSGDETGSDGGAGQVDCTDEEFGVPHPCQGAQGEVCCAVSQEDNYCAADCSAGGLALACDGPEDCDGNACCGGTSTTCAAGPSCEGSDQVVCKTSGDCPAEAPCCFAYVLNGVRMRGCTGQDLPSCL